MTTMSAGTSPPLPLTRQTNEKLSGDFWQEHDPHVNVTDIMRSTLAEFQMVTDAQAVVRLIACLKKVRRVKIDQQIERLGFDETERILTFKQTNARDQ